MSSASRRRRARFVLKWGGNILVLGGLAALIWCGMVLWQAHVFEARAARYLAQKMPAGYPSSRQGEPIGWIDIPSAGVSVPVLSGDDDQSLRLGAGHIPGTALPGETGNVGLAGHRDTCFRGLREVHKGDQIVLTTPAGSYVYVVDVTKVVAPGDVGVLKASTGRLLTLVTCYPFYFIGPAPRRFIVRAHQMEKRPQHPASFYTPAKENVP